MSSPVMTVITSILEMHERSREARLDAGEHCGVYESIMAQSLPGLLTSLAEADLLSRKELDEYRQAASVEATEGDAARAELARIRDQTGNGRDFGPDGLGDHAFDTNTNTNAD